MQFLFSVRDFYHRYVVALDWHQRRRSRLHTYRLLTVPRYLRHADLPINNIPIPTWIYQSVIEEHGIRSQGESQQLNAPLVPNDALDQFMNTIDELCTRILQSKGIKEAYKWVDLALRHRIVMELVDKDHLKVGQSIACLDRKHTRGS